MASDNVTRGRYVNTQDEQNDSIAGEKKYGQEANRSQEQEATGTYTMGDEDEQKA